MGLIEPSCTASRTGRLNALRANQGKSGRKSVPLRLPTGEGIFARERITLGPAGAGLSRSTSDVHLRALQAWRSLPHEEQLRWKPFAWVVAPHRPPFDHLARISENNLFISACHGFTTLGREHVPAPVPFENFPTYQVKILGATAAEGTLFIRWKLEMEDGSGRYRLLTKTGYRSQFLPVSGVVEL